MSDAPAEAWLDAQWWNGIKAEATEEPWDDDDLRYIRADIHDAAEASRMEALARLAEATAQRIELKAAHDAALARIAELERALNIMMHAVCGETGFANSVRQVSGLAYPWPALDDAERIARAALSANK